MASGTIKVKTPVNYQQFTPNTTMRLSASMLACTVLFITIRRYGYFDSVTIPTLLITTGSVESNGCKLNYGNNAITLTISASGVITLAGTSVNELYVEVYGI